MRTLEEVLVDARSAPDDPTPVVPLSHTPLDHLLTLEAVRAQTDGLRWPRAAGLVSSVTGLRLERGILHAEVRTPTAHVVTLSAQSGRLVGTCICPDAHTRSPDRYLPFCKHMAATGLAALGWADISPLLPPAEPDPALLDPDALARIVTTAVQHPNGLTTRDLARVELVIAGQLPALDAVRGMVAEATWDATDPGRSGRALEALVVRVAALPPGDQARVALRVLNGLAKLVERGYQPDDVAFLAALNMLTGVCAAFPEDSLERMGTALAPSLRTLTQWWGWRDGADVDALMTLLVALRDSGRRGLHDTLLAAVDVPPTPSPEDQVAWATWWCVLQGRSDGDEIPMLVLAVTAAGSADPYPAAEALWVAVNATAQPEECPTS